MFFSTFRRHAPTTVGRIQHGRSRPAPPRPTARHLGLEPLEARTLLSLGFGWAFNVGGLSQDAGWAITTDTSGNFYARGYCLSSNVNFDPNHTNLSNPNNTLTNSGIFVAKYTSNMTFQWVSAVGMSQQGGIAVDGAGNVYIAYLDGSNNTDVAQLDTGSGMLRWTVSLAGSSASDAAGGPYAGVAVGPSGDVYVTGRNAAAHAFVAKLDASGNVLWNQQPSGSSTDGLAVAVDRSENVYVAYGNSSQVLVGKLSSSSGSTVWTGSVGSNGNVGAGIAVDSAGNVYVTGGGSLATSYRGFFVVKLVPGPNGYLTQSWNERISGFTWSTSMAVDVSGNVYTTGSFEGSIDFDPGPGQYIITATKGGCDIFVSKLDTNGNFVAAADIVRGNGKDNYGHGIAVDNSSPGSPNVYTTGGFRGMGNFNPAGTYDLTVNGGSTSSMQDIFVSKLTQSSSAGGAAALSSPDTGRNFAVPIVSSPISLPYVSETINPLPAASGRAAPREMVLELALASVQQPVPLPVGPDTGLRPATLPRRQQPWLDRFFAAFEDRSIQDLVRGERTLA